MKNCWGDIAFLYDSFESEIIEINGLPYVLEKYQNGNIWSEEEEWGTCIFDLTNKRAMLWYTYNDDVKWWKEYIENHSELWDNTCYMNEETLNYYINEYKTNFIKDKYNSI